MWEDVLKNLIAVPKQKLRSSKRPLPEESDCLERFYEKVYSVRNIPDFKYNVITTGNYDKQGADWIAWIGENTVTNNITYDNLQYPYKTFTKDDRTLAIDDSILTTRFIPSGNKYPYSHGIYIDFQVNSDLLTEELACFVLDRLSENRPIHGNFEIDGIKYELRVKVYSSPDKIQKYSIVKLLRIENPRTIISTQFNVIDFHLEDDVGFKITASSNFDKINVEWWK